MTVLRRWTGSAWEVIGGLAGSSLVVQDENVTLTSTASQIDFQGAGVSAALVGGEVVVTVPGANPIAQIEVDVTAALGGPARSGRFTIADASFLAGDQLYVQQGAEAISTKGTRPDENEMDNLDLRGLVTAAGTGTVYWSSQTYVKGRFPINYRSS